MEKKVHWTDQIYNELRPVLYFVAEVLSSLPV